MTMSRIRKPTLVPEWRRAWRYASVQIGSAAAVFGLLPADQQAAMLAAVGLRADQLPLVMGVAFLAARLWAQPVKPQAE
jgi:hypothetical protein